MTFRWPARAAVRDVVSYVVGLSGLAYEAVIHSGPPRWPLIVAWLFVAGFPVATGLDALKDRLDGQPKGPE